MNKHDDAKLALVLAYGLGQARAIQGLKKPYASHHLLRLLNVVKWRTGHVRQLNSAQRMGHWNQTLANDGGEG